MSCNGQNIAGSDPSERKYFSHVNECGALTEQVPLASNIVLTCFDVGYNYIVFGSNCGALFIFNRRLNRSAAPLRTNSDDLITCVKFSSGGKDLLAAGRKSGDVILLSLPSGKPDSARKLEQVLFSDGHKGHAVTYITWTEDGRRVFSADDTGVVVVTSVDFACNVFQTTFVYHEHLSVVQLVHINSLLMVCTSQRVTIIDENSSNSVFEISEEQQKISGIHATFGSCSAELFVLLSNGIINTYDMSSGEKKGSLILPDNIMQKLSTAQLSSYRRSQQRMPFLTMVQSHILAIAYYSYIVLLNFENEAAIISLFDLNDVFRSETCKLCWLCVDPRSSWPTLYVLGSDNRVFRLSSDEAASYLTEAHEMREGFSTKNFLLSFKKTAKLLPHTSKDVVWSGFKVAKGMNVFSSLQNLSLPILNTLIESDGVLQNANGKFATDQSLESVDSELNEWRSTNMYDRVSISRKLEQMRIQPSVFLDNVSKVARKLVDTVGSFGTQPENGFVMQPVYDANVVGAEETLYPVEQSGMLQEIMVRRAKKAPTNKRKKIIDEEFDSQDMMDSLTEELSLINENALENIKKVLIHTSKINCGLLLGNDIHNVNDEVVSSNPKVQEVTLISERNDYIDRKCGKQEFVARESSVVELSSGENAYENLMKNAMENKPSITEREAINVIYRPDPECLLNKIVTVNNFGDSWTEIKLPYSCSSFSASSSYIIICHSKRRKKPCYLSIPYCGIPRWITLKKKAEQFVVNDRGTLVWKIVKHIAYAPVENGNELVLSHTSAHWTAVTGHEGGGVVEVTLTNDSAWYITRSGDVYVQLRLPKMGILSRCETSWPLHSITASEVAVWALQTETGRLVVRVGLKHSPVGLDWVEIVPNGPTRLISVCLHDQTGWALDEKRSLWFTNGVRFQNPFGSSGNWMKVFNPWDSSPALTHLRCLPWTIRVSSAGVFVCVDHKCYWASATSMLSGHCLECVVPEKLAINDNFEMISGGGLNGEDGEFITLCRANEVYLYRLGNGNFYSLPAFPASFGSDVIEISSFDRSVYILNSSGCIYVKENISKVSPFGSEWKLLDTGPCGAPVVSFAVTCTSLWVVTAAGEACLYLKKEIKEPFVGTNPVWLHVQPLVGTMVNKIRASFNGAYVWIFSRTSGHAWARSFVSDVEPSGKSWKAVSNEFPVRDLAVGCKVIWSLSASGLLHRLQGLACGNPAGNCWKPVPLLLKTITVDRKDRLWGIDVNGRLVFHKIELYPPMNDHHLSGFLD